eukprot:1683342-Rhodomonas_salina.2
MVNSASCYARAMRCPVLRSSLQGVRHVPFRRNPVHERDRRCPGGTLLRASVGWHAQSYISVEVGIGVLLAAVSPYIVEEDVQKALT